MNMHKFRSAYKLYVDPIIDRDALSIMCAINGGQLYRDRFNILNQFSNWNMVDLVDNIPTFSETGIDVLIDCKAQQIAAAYNNIVLLWSGGVDSTTILCALLNVCRKNQLTVLCTSESIKEFPAAYDLIQKHNVDVLIRDNDFFDVLKTIDCDCIVTGWGADQLFGSYIFMKPHAKDLFYKPWKDGFSILANRMIPTINVDLEQIFGQIDQLSGCLNVRLTNFGSYAWLFNFAVKMSHVRDIIKLQISRYANFDRIVNFFDDYQFDCWSVSQDESRFDVNMYENSSYYKPQLKQYISQFIKDEKFVRNKGKQPSWVNLPQKPTTLQTIYVWTDDHIEQITAENLQSIGFMLFDTANRFRKQTAVV